MLPPPVSEPAIVPPPVSATPAVAPALAVAQPTPPSPQPSPQPKPQNPQNLQNPQNPPNPKTGEKVSDAKSEPSTTSAASGAEKRTAEGLKKTGKELNNESSEMDVACILNDLAKANKDNGDCLAFFDHLLLSEVVHTQQHISSCDHGCLLSLPVDDSILQAHGSINMDFASLSIGTPGVDWQSLRYIYALLKFILS